MTHGEHDRHRVEHTAQGWVATCATCGAATEPHAHPIDASGAATAHFNAQRRELENGRRS
jgi:hypothetical protein